jgi:hypothetical protein
MLWRPIRLCLPKQDDNGWLRRLGDRPSTRMSGQLADRVGVQRQFCCLLLGEHLLLPGAGMVLRDVGPARGLAHPAVSQASRQLAARVANSVTARFAPRMRLRRMRRGLDDVHVHDDGPQLA